MSEGYFTIERALLEHNIWTEEPFTKGQAWVDLIGRANFKKKERLYGGRCITIGRGQLITSTRALAKRWQWSEKKVRNFLGALKDAEMVSTKGTALGTLITVENYTKYQPQGRAKDTAEEQALDADRTQTGRTEGIHKKKEKKEKNDKKGEYARTRATPDDDWVIVYDPEEDER